MIHLPTIITSRADFRHSFDFDGSSYFSIPDHDDFSFITGSPDAPFSVSAWVYMDDATLFRILSKLDADVGASTGEWGFATGGTDKLSFSCHQNGFTTQVFGTPASATLTADEGSWVHLGGGYDGAGLTSSFALYKNGAVYSTNGGSSGSYTTGMANGTHPLLIGHFNTQYANGKIARVGLWNTEMDAAAFARIEALGNQFDPTRNDGDYDYSSNLVAFWPLDEGVGTSCRDISGNGHTGTLTGNQVWSLDTPPIAP